MKSYLTTTLLSILISMVAFSQTDLTISGTAPVPEFIGSTVTIQLWPSEQNFAEVTIDENGEFSHVFDLTNYSLNGSATVSHCEGVFYSRSYGIGNMDLVFELGLCSDSSLYFGCTDPLAINYQSNANSDDGSCVYSECDPLSYAICYNDQQDDFVIPSTGSELVITWDQAWYFYEGDGCRIYDGVDATGDLVLDFDDYYAEGGMLISQSGNFYFEFDLDPESSSCEESGINPLVFEVYCGVLPIPGCTDPEAINFTEGVGIDDGSCVYSNCEPEFFSYCYGNNGDSFLITANGVEPIVVEILHGSIEDEWDSLTIYDGMDAGGIVIYGPAEGDQSGVILEATSGAMYFSFDSDGSVSCESGSEITMGMEVYCGEVTIPIPGCTDEEALNFNPDATIDDGSCVFESDCEISFTWEVNPDSAQVYVFVPDLVNFPQAEYSWSFGDGSTTNYPYPVYFYQSEGTYEVCLTVSNPWYSCYDTYCEEITYSGVNGNGEFEMLPAGFTLIVNPEPIINVEEQSMVFEEMEVYPNPTSPQNLKIRIVSRTNEEVKLELYDLMGRMVDSKQMFLQAGNNEISPQLESNIAPGQYLIRIHTVNSSNQITKKVFFTE